MKPYTDSQYNRYIVELFSEKKPYHGLDIAIATLIALTVWLLVMVAGCEPAYGETDYGSISNEVIANAIYKAENSARFPYGIKSIDTRGDEAYARKICLNSIRNNKVRWEKAGKPEDFVTFMSRRYCPVGAPDDPNGLNINWSRNVKYFIGREVTND